MFLNVLIVEDNASDAALIKEDLQQETLHYSWRAIHVTRLSDAIACIQQQPIDAVLLDLSLPDCQGLEGITTLQSFAPSVPIVVLTGTDNLTKALEAVANGAQDYLVKGQISHSLLVRSIRYAIERTHLETKKLETLERERQLNQLKADFVTMSSHEFRTPLTAIRMATELLQKNAAQLTELQREKYFESIHRAIGSMLQLLDAVLLLGKANAEGLHYEPVQLELKAHCQNLVETFELLISGSHRILFETPDVLPDVEMDGNLLHHILTNLLSNAVKYSAPGSLVQLLIQPEENVIRFQVVDQGIGIPPDGQNHLFETFYRATNVGRIQGTGLGLAIVKKCVMLHYGEIEVSSTVGVGTTFTVRLPRTARPKT